MTIIEVARLFNDGTITGAMPRSHYAYGNTWFTKESMDRDFLTWDEVLDDWDVTSVPEEEWE